MKKLVILIMGILGCFFLGACNTNVSNIGVNDLTFVQHNSYHGYSVEEEPTISLRFFDTIEENRDFSKVVLFSNNHEFEAKNLKVSTEKNYQNTDLCKLNLTLPSLEPGKYTIDKIRIYSKDSSRDFNIGTWILDIKNIPKYEDIELKKYTILTGYFYFYKLELENITDKNLRVKELVFMLPELDVDYEIYSSHDFSNISEIYENTFLTSNSTQAFSFNFECHNNKYLESFISFKPFLKYTVNEEIRLMTLPTAFYSPLLSYREEQMLEKYTSN
ncbi:hypothetical protein RBH29_13505 [Herbivorax sp. ANBcel31]|uniref:hypothetical protein n=1 Tax=Herbivorax sp. ANBcel31 TaxID=3069754 RepID=UPI0027B8403F|nr:hypothetical protein [Herbivorax sp. ANBcel31]MDQ2087443.1 hypothetical protein [Herbivorax sp. ANBcel31]